mgnify:CR=1 FL=1
MDKITHIYHDGFVAELEEQVLIFDWYTGKLPQFDTGKKVTVFVSHSHRDHYGEIIFSLMDICPDLVYVTDRKVRVKKETADRLGKSRLVRVSAGDDAEVHGLRIHAFRSTDIGVAFLAEAGDKLYFHAGDLNIWYWEGEADADNRWQAGTYRSEIDKLERMLGGRHLEAAFLPLDPRLEAHAPDGMLYFLSHIPVRHVYPMHYWDDEEKMKRYLELPELKKYADVIAEPSLQASDLRSGQPAASRDI